MRLIYKGRGRLQEGGEAIAHGQTFTVSTKRGEQLLANPSATVEVADLHELTRPELNELAATAGITSPEALPNKESVIEALTPSEPHEGSTTTDQEAPDAEH